MYLYIFSIRTARRYLSEYPALLDFFHLFRPMRIWGTVFERIMLKKLFLADNSEEMNLTGIYAICTELLYVKWRE